MALPSNVRMSQDGRDLKFFSPLPFKDSSEVNVFAQNLSSSENCYVFPPFVFFLTSQIFELPAYQSNSHRSRYFPQTGLVASSPCLEGRQSIRWIKDAT